MVGNLESTTYRNGLVSTYTYNERNMLRMVETLKSGNLRGRFDYDGADSGVIWANEWKLSPSGQRRGPQEVYGSLARTVTYAYDRH